MRRRQWGWRRRNGGEKMLRAYLPVCRGQSGSSACCCKHSPATTSGGIHPRLSHMGTSTGTEMNWRIPTTLPWTLCPRSPSHLPIGTLDARILLPSSQAPRVLLHSTIIGRAQQERSSFSFLPPSLSLRELRSLVVVAWRHVVMILTEKQQRGVQRKRKEVEASSTFDSHHGLI